jgi:hypothetical protein
MRILFALVAWGNDYVRDFLDVSLPTLLADGNLAAAGPGSRLMILTTARDVPMFESNPHFTAVKRIVATEFVDISRLRTRDKYQFVSRCQLEALRQSEDYDAVILLYPDMIWCSGGVRFAVEHIKAGALGVFAPAPAVLPEPTLADLRSNAQLRIDGASSFSVSPRELAGIALRHHHPMWDGFDWDGGCFTDYPSCLRWNVPGHPAWLIHCFHLHPVALRVQRHNPRFVARFTTSLDGEYVARLFDGTDDLAFATDTDEFAMVTLRERTMPPFPKPNHRSGTAELARWAESNAYLLHRAFAGVGFRWHAEAVAEASWQAVERRARTILGEARDRLHTPDTIIRIEDPQAYQARRQRRRNAACGGAPVVDLPPSYARQPRTQLAAALLNKTVYRAAVAAKSVVGLGMLGRWLRQQPLAVALWVRTRRAFEPESPIHAAASTRSFLRSILASKR